MPVSGEYVEPVFRLVPSYFVLWKARFMFREGVSWEVSLAKKRGCL